MRGVGSKAVRATGELEGAELAGADSGRLGIVMGAVTGTVTAGAALTGDVVVGAVLVGESGARPGLSAGAGVVGTKGEEEDCAHAPDISRRPAMAQNFIYPLP